MNSAADADATPSLVVLEPFLHFDPTRIYNPLRDLEKGPREGGFKELVRVHEGDLTVAQLAPELRRQLAEQGWLVPDKFAHAGRFHLKYASLEANTTCNQTCYFCPVATHPRETQTMTMDFYELIVGQLAEHRSTLEGVSMVHYNEPTADPLFIERLGLLRRYDLPAAVLTNATGLTPKRVDAISDLGGLRYLSVNLSSLDPVRYAAERGHDHLASVLRNLDYCRDLRLAPQMEIVVLGCGDRQHRADFKQIDRRFEGSAFEVKYHEVMDRAGNLPVGHGPAVPHGRLCGCEQTGSRPLQWIHITPSGQCVLCCQDYHDRHVVGDLAQQRLDDVLAGPELARLRRWVYGIDDAPDDFICRHCIYARTR